MIDIRAYWRIIFYDQIIRRNKVADDIYFLFLQDLIFQINRLRIHMKCQDLFSLNKKCYLLQLWLAL